MAVTTSPNVLRLEKKVEQSILAKMFNYFYLFSVRNDWTAALLTQFSLYFYAKSHQNEYWFDQFKHQIKVNAFVRDNDLKVAVWEFYRTFVQGHILLHLEFQTKENKFIQWFKKISLNFLAICNYSFGLLYRYITIKLWKWNCL